MDDYEKIYATLALDETLLSEDPRATIKHSPDRGMLDTLGALPLLHLSDGDGFGGELQIGRTLGEGGMGIIRAATQAPFGRDVALKTVRSERNDDHAVQLSLVREAIAAGRLEHPHIVPIYAVGRDASGQPLIVMKRIDGASWREHFDEPDRIAADDKLVWHLRVFLDVCAAVHFAHGRGVIHRDLKLDNVMIGAHEDTYVVDWGLALSLMPDPAHKLPHVGDVSEVVGTPACMAPEMAAGGSEPLDERTDVYLLGAMLHEILTGTPRHSGTKLYEILLHAYRSEPVDYTSDVPPELAAICNRATSRPPGDRFRTALALRDAVQRYLDHRGAAALTTDATEQLQALEVALTNDALTDDERRIAVYRRYGASRFGFDRSLGEWPDQPPAQEGLQRTLELMIDWELGHGSVHAAEALLADLPEPRPHLATRIAEVARSQSEERAELEAHREREHQLDVKVGSRSRALQAALLICGGLVVPATIPWALGGVEWFDDPLFFWLVAVAVAIFTVAFNALAWRRRSGWLSFARTELNRRIAVSVAIVCVYLVAFRGLSMLGGVPIPLQLSLELLAFGMFAATLAAFLDHKLAGSAALYFLFGVIAFLVPSSALTFYVVGNTAALSWVVWIWRAAPDAIDPLHSDS